MFKGVNHIYYVHLRWGYVDSGMGGFVVLGNMVRGWRWIRQIGIIV